MQKLFKAKNFLNEFITRNKKVLLVNPPVMDVRYNWIKWNQPLDLLKLASLLKSQYICEVALFDFMVPSSNGKVSQSLDGQKEVLGSTFLIKHYGKKFDYFRKKLSDLKVEWVPDVIIITSLTSYWWEALPKTINTIKNIFPNSLVCLTGNYAFYEKTHASNNTYADIIIEDRFILNDVLPDIGIYQEPISNQLCKGKPLYCAITLHTNTHNTLKEIINGLTNGYSNFIFFNEDLLIHEGMVLKELLKSLEQVIGNCHQKPRFYGICGILPSKLKNDVLKDMLDYGFVDLYVEYETDSNNNVTLETYESLVHNFNVYGQVSKDFLTSFVNIGFYQEDLSKTITNMLILLKVVGRIIVKPQTPVPGTDLYESIKKKMGNLSFISPHFYPFSEENNISRNDYNDLNRLSAFLNNKIRGKTFDFFDQSVVTTSLIRSLCEERWKQ